MGTKKHLGLIGLFALLFLLLGLPLSPTRQAVAASYYTLTVNYGSDLPYGTDSNGGVVSSRTSTQSKYTYNTGDTSSVYYNSNVKLYILPDPGYQINNIWLHNGTSYTSYKTSLVDEGGGWFSFTFNMQSKNWDFYADFAPIISNYNVNYSVVVPTCTPSMSSCSAGLNGSINGFSASSLPKTAVVAKGSNLTFNMTPDAGYVVNDVQTSTDDGTTWISQGAGTTSYTFSNVQSNCRLRASFIPQPYTITATAGSNGTLSPGGLGPSTNYITVQKNANQTFTISPAAGYRVLNVVVTDTTAGYSSTSLGSITSYTFTNVTSNSDSISATFAPINTSIDNYCQIPPFAGKAQTLMPNVMFIVDNSGSMGDNAYTSGTYYSTKTYYGYFDTTKMYKLSGTVYSIDTTKTLDLTSNYSGNKLNYLYMEEVDVIRKALIGGKVSGRGTGTMSLMLDNGYSISLPTGTAEPTGVLQTLVGKVNFGVMFFNVGTKYESGSGTDGGYVASPLTSDAASLNNVINLIQAADPSTNTPLAETMYEAVRYFKHTTSAYNTGVDYSTGADPIQYPCQKNFVILLTDGQPTQDANLPGTAFSSGRTVVSDASLSINNSGKGIKDWMDKIATNEGYASQWNVKPGGVTWATYYLEGIAYWMHNTDLRPDVSGNQNLTLYTVYAFGSDAYARDILMKSAKYGGYNDKNNNGVPDGGQGSLEWNVSNSVDSSGTPIPDNYFEATEGDSLTNSINSAITSILAHVSSGTAASILSNSEGTGANLLQAVFYPDKIFDNQTEGYWLGELHSLWYYIDPFVANSSVREDTDYFKNYRNPPDVPVTVDAAHSFDLIKDWSVNFRFDGTQTVADLSQDTNGNGTPDTVSFSVNPDEVHSIWRAGKKLWAKTAASRKVYTPCIGSATCSNGLMSFNDSYKTIYKPYLQAADDAESAKIIDYALGTDQPNYRSRTVSILTDSGVYGSNVWKLGDIISSTPKIQSSQRQNSYNLASPQGYGDLSYGNESSKANGYVYTNAYKQRGMVYVGANDGMLHAFKLGVLDVTSSGTQRATLSGTSLGDEAWAFIPKSTLPYLRYLGDPNYGDKHVFYLDSTPTIVDASVGSCSDPNYWTCAVDKTNGSNWRTILVGGMGTGGASRAASAPACTDCVVTPTTDPTDLTGTKGFGYSSYYALDITDPANPVFLWEFNDPTLGFTTSGPAIVRHTAVDSSGKLLTDRNGRWFAVFVSGPTGGIVATEFKGNSDQNLKVFVVDLKTGAVVSTIDTLADGSKLSNAFAGSITAGPIDTDRWNPSLPGYYQDDAVYIGYSQYNGSSWTGGVLRLVSNEKLDPSTNLPTWKLSKVIDGIGPVTNNIGRLQDRKNHNLWLYFGSGRYFYGADDPTTQQKLVGIKDPCYNSSDKLDYNCTTKKSLSDLTLQNGDLKQVTNQGWYINMRPQDTVKSFNAERVISDPVAMTNGAVFFTTFSPTSNICNFGGNSSMWALKYDTGGPPMCPAVTKTKVLVQVSTGSFEQIDGQSAFACYPGPNSPLQQPTIPPSTGPAGWTPPLSQPSYALVGKPPGQAPPVISNAALKPIKRILHIQER
jgi:type IV pilus assembly protein PilY1